MGDIESVQKYDALLRDLAQNLRSPFPHRRVGTLKELNTLLGSIQSHGDDNDDDVSVVGLATCTDAWARTVSSCPGRTIASFAATLPEAAAWRAGKLRGDGDGKVNDRGPVLHCPWRALPEVSREAAWECVEALRALAALSAFSAGARAGAIACGAVEASLAVAEAAAASIVEAAGDGSAEGGIGATGVPFHAPWEAVLSETQASDDARSGAPPCGVVLEAAWCALLAFCSDGRVAQSRFIAAGGASVARKALAALDALHGGAMSKTAGESVPASEAGRIKKAIALTATSLDTVAAGGSSGAPPIGQDSAKRTEAVSDYTATDPDALATAFISEFGGVQALNAALGDFGRI